MENRILSKELVLGAFDQIELYIDYSNNDLIMSYKGLIDEALKELSLSLEDKTMRPELFISISLMHIELNSRIFGKESYKDFVFSRSHLFLNYDNLNLNDLFSSLILLELNLLKFMAGEIKVLSLKPLIHFFNNLSFFLEKEELWKK